MSELDKIPQKVSIDLETVKIEEELLNSIRETNTQINVLFADMGQIHIRRKEINEELIRLEEILEETENNFKSVNLELRELMDALDEKYPQGRADWSEGKITYQPGAPSRKKLAEMERERAEGGNQNGGFKVIKD